MAKWSVVKNSYNQGTRIATSADPTWSLEDDSDHTPITSTHTPCGYWPGTITTPKEYTYILAVLSSYPYQIAKIDYYTGEIYPDTILLPGAISILGAFPTIYKGKLYVWTLCGDVSHPVHTLYEVDIDAKITTRVLPIAIEAGQGPGYRVGNMLYLYCSSDAYGGPNFRNRIYEIDLDTFSATGRVFTLAWNYGPALNIVIRGNLMFVASTGYVIVVDFKTFTTLSTYYYGSSGSGVSATFTNDKTACIIALNNYDPCLIKISLTNPPTLLATRDTNWLPFMRPSEMTIDYNDTVYVCDKFNLKLHKFNGAAWDNPVTYDYVEEYAYGRAMRFESPQIAGEDLWCCNNYTWIDDYRRVFRIDKNTMKVKHVISVPAPEYVPAIYPIILY